MNRKKRAWVRKNRRRWTHDTVGDHKGRSGRTGRMHRKKNAALRDGVAKRKRSVDR